MGDFISDNFIYIFYWFVITSISIKYFLSAFIISSFIVQPFLYLIKRTLSFFSVHLNSSVICYSLLSKHLFIIGTKETSTVYHHVNI